MIIPWRRTGCGLRCLCVARHRQPEGRKEAPKAPSATDGCLQDTKRWCQTIIFVYLQPYVVIIFQKHVYTIQPYVVIIFQKSVYKPLIQGCTKYLVGGFKRCLCSTVYLGWWSAMTCIFQWGWNHQTDFYVAEWFAAKLNSIKRFLNASKLYCLLWNMNLFILHFDDSHSPYLFLLEETCLSSSYL